jgi:RNA polymerase sigma-70 factor (ECF subfamily)
MDFASPSRTHITAMLRAWSGGKEPASDELIRAVYHELRRLARRHLHRERPNHTLDTAGLINEAYLRLVEQRSVHWQDRRHFYALSAELMRRVLVDHARSRHRQKRGGPNEAHSLDHVQVFTGPVDLDLVALDQALDRLAKIDALQVKVVEMRYFAGLGVVEIAEVLKISPATVKREWAAAKAWLKHELTREVAG